MKSNSALSLVTVALALLFSPILWARIDLPVSPSREFEVKFSQAVLLYRSEKLKEALALTEQISKQEISQKNLELRALILKDMGRTADAKKAHLDLLARTKKAGLERKVAASSLFELGTLAFAEKEWEESLNYFNECLRYAFNTTGSRFYRGVIYLNQKNFDPALEDFYSVVSGDSSLLKAQAYLFIAKTYSALEKYDEAISALYKAKLYVDQQLKNKDNNTPYLKDYEAIQQAIKASVDKIDRTSMVRSLALFIGHDSNVLGVPEVGSVADLFSKKSSNVAYLKAQIGNLSSVFASRQSFWAYQFFGNYTATKETEIGRFLVNDVNYISTWNHLNPTNHSLRVHLNSTFQYQRNLETDKAQYSPYSLTGDISYTLKQIVNVKDTFIQEALIRYDSFLLDPVFSDYLKKTGSEAQYTVAWMRDSSLPLWNPKIEIKVRQRDSKGTEFRMTGASITLGNVFYINTKNLFSIGFNVGSNNYNQRPLVKRKDDITQVQLDWFYSFSRSLKGNLNYQWYNNGSNIEDLYRFERQTVFAGMSYFF